MLKSSYGTEGVPEKGQQNESDNVGFQISHERNNHLHGM
jgi:hypothetical protein